MTNKPNEAVEELKKEFILCYENGGDNGGMRASPFIHTNGERIADWWINKLTQAIQTAREEERVVGLEHFLIVLNRVLRSGTTPQRIQCIVDDVRAEYKYLTNK